jgi:RNAse (barnase) inhibitor barstar
MRLFEFKAFPKQEEIDELMDKYGKLSKQLRELQSSWEVLYKQSLLPKPSTHVSGTEVKFYKLAVYSSTEALVANYVDTHWKTILQNAKDKLVAEIQDVLKELREKLA